jgi:hypothetical protein
MVSILECEECLRVLEQRLVAEIESGAIPNVSDNLAGRIMDEVARASSSVSTAASNPGTTDNAGYRHIETHISKRNRALSFLRYITAAAATIIMLMSGSFNIVSQSGTEYGNSLNKAVNGISNKAMKVTNSVNGDVSFGKNWSHVLMKNIDDLKNGLHIKIDSNKGR